MRKVLFSVAAAASVLAIATPAAAQYYPAPPAYGQGYGYGYGYNNFGHVRALQGRVDRIQRDLSHLARQRMISRSEYHNRNQDAREIERKLRRDARDGRGLNRQEVYNVERRIARLEQKIARDVRDARRFAYRW